MTQQVSPHSAPQASQPAAKLLLPFLALALGAVAMGVSPLFVRWADVGPFTSAFWRAALAAPALYIWMRLDERNAPPAGAFAFMGWPTVAAGLAFAGDLFFWHLSIFKTSVANATFFATLVPIWVMAFSWLFYRQRPQRHFVFGLAICLPGGGALLGESFGISAGHMLGDLFGIVTGMFFSLYFLAVAVARRGSGAARVTFQLTCVTAAALLAVALVMEQKFWPSSARGWLMLLAMAWISHVGGQGLLSIALGRLPTGFSSLVIFLEAIAAALLGWAFLGEAISLAQALGGLAIVAGIYVARPRAA